MKQKLFLPLYFAAAQLPDFSNSLPLITLKKGWMLYGLSVNFSKNYDQETYFELFKADVIYNENTMDSLRKYMSLADAPSAFFKVKDATTAFQIDQDLIRIKMANVELHKLHEAQPGADFVNCS